MIFMTGHGYGFASCILFSFRLFDFFGEGFFFCGCLRNRGKREAKDRHEREMS